MGSASRCTWSSIVVALVAALLGTGPAVGDIVQVEGSTGMEGISLRSESPAGVEIHYEMGSYAMEPLEIAGETYQHIGLPAVFLPNDAGAPDLPGMGRFIALPQGSVANLQIVSARMQTIQGIEISPAPVIPRENDDSPLVYEKNMAIYGRDAMYPEAPALLSEPLEIRGVDAVTLGITPFQYNPVTKELVIYTELDIRIDFQGGTSYFGEDRLRSRYWEPILANHLLNYQSLPQIDFNQPEDLQTGHEYLIITPDDPTFIAWADTLKNWRKLEGIDTEVYTTTEIGGTSSLAIESWLNDCYQNWSPAPSAFLILADYPTSGFRETGITSPVWNSYCISDNMYADVNGDNLPDMVHARITARDAAELETMIGKMLDYERAPYTDPGFYDHPVIAGGWQTERWFILCTEICLGHQEHVLGKNPVREYAIYSGTPGSTWSTNQNTYMLLNYFGPNGLGYIPATPGHLTDWGANAARVTADLNAGAYMLLHRDHGGESGWGEPNYSTSHLSGLTNDMYPFVFSINCLTGKYNWNNECFTEAFHRMNHGALGLIAASEVSYSFVNDTFIFGLFDGMWPEFMPDYGPEPPYTRFPTNLRPGFGMANGKYFLQASNWPYNSQSKDETHHLFHHHGDAFLRMYSEVPQHLTVDYAGILFIGASSFSIQADEGSTIALTVDGEIIAVAEATGMMQDIPITPQTEPGTLRITVTKTNCFRYDEEILILPPSGPYLMFDTCSVLDPGGDDDGIMDAGETVGFEITLDNLGADPSSGISAELSSGDPYVVITTATQSFPDIPAGGYGTCLEPFVVEVTINTPDEHVVAFTLTTTSNEGQWEDNFNLPVEAPILVSGHPYVDDSGGSANGDGGADPGETFLLDVSLLNTGHSATAGLTGTLSSSHPHVVIHDDQGDCPPVPDGGENLMGTFQIEVLSSCPNATMVPIQIAVSATNGLSAILDYEFAVGPWFDDGERERGWTLGIPGDDATSGIWVREDPAGTYLIGQPVQPEDDHTPEPGVTCFVTGNVPPGSPPTVNDVNGTTTLMSPVFDLEGASSATLSYWRWFYSNPGEDWWTVDVTADGENWVHIEETQESDNAWNQFTFEVSDYVGFTRYFQVRFIASDRGSVSLVDAAVDDFSLDVIRPPTAGLPADDVEAVRVPSGIVSCSPNPFNPHVSIVYRVGREVPVRLQIYDVTGRLVRTLVDGPVAAGEHTVVFDGRNAAGSSAASGVYFLHLETPEIMQVRQLTLIK